MDVIPLSLVTNNRKGTKGKLDIIVMSFGQLQQEATLFSPRHHWPIPCRSLEEGTEKKER